jgi:hypothetical protein
MHQTKKRKNFPFFTMAVLCFLLSVCQVTEAGEGGTTALVSAVTGVLLGVLGTLAWLRNREVVIVKFDVLSSANTTPGWGDIAPTPGLYVINRKRHTIRVEEMWVEDMSGNRLKHVKFRNAKTEIETPKQIGKPSVRWEHEWPRPIPPDEHYAFPTSYWEIGPDVDFVRGVVRFDLDEKKRSKKLDARKYRGRVGQMSEDEILDDEIKEGPKPL